MGIENRWKASNVYVQMPGFRSRIRENAGWMLSASDSRGILEIVIKRRE